MKYGKEIAWDFICLGHSRQPDFSLYSIKVFTGKFSPIYEGYCRYPISHFAPEQTDILSILYNSYLQKLITKMIDNIMPSN
jgi:hypothetical protein